jgi:hypothetical protein
MIEKMINWEGWNCNGLIDVLFQCLLGRKTTEKTRIRNSRFLRSKVYKIKESADFWDLTLYSLEKNWRFGGTYCLHLRVLKIGDDVLIWNSWFCPKQPAVTNQGTKIFLSPTEGTSTPIQKLFSCLFGLLYNIPKTTETSFLVVTHIIR